MDNKTLHDNFRRQLTNTHGVTVLTISLLEILAYVVLVRSGTETLSWDNRYLWWCVVVPIVVNMLTHVVARILVFYAPIRRRRKNIAIIGAAMVTSFMVAVPHKEYIVTGCAFVFPMILSAMFNDRKLLNASLVASLCIWASVGVTFGLEGGLTLTNALNLLVLFGFAWIAYLCGVISINFSRQNYMIIKRQAEKNSKLLEDVRHDRMTGLYNHQAFLEDLSIALDAVTADVPLCLSIVDLDDFKKVNDTYGHDCGDEVLVHLSDAIHRHCDEHDRAYRYGGEEFAILFWGKHVEEAYGRMNDLLASVRDYRFGFSDAPITFSAGVVEYADGITREAFFEAADRMMYDAKRSGKNRVFRSY